MALNQKWTDMIDGAVKDVSWDDHDKVLQREVAQYVVRLNLKADWKMFKAQIWTESGAAVAAWNTRPMQIGNAGDPALATLKAGKENSSIVMSEQVRKDLHRGRSIDEPEFNIQLGLAYAYTKLSTFDSVVADQTKLTYEVKSGDSIEAIASRIGTTKKNLLLLNPIAKSTIFPKQKLIYQKSSIKPVSIAVTPERLQADYNGNGDPDYAKKINYCSSVIARLRR